MNFNLQTLKLPTEKINFYNSNQHLWQFFLRPIPEEIKNQSISADEILIWSNDQLNSWGLKTKNETSSYRKSALKKVNLTIERSVRGGSFNISTIYNEAIPKNEPFLGDVGRVLCPIIITYGNEPHIEFWYQSFVKIISSHLSLEYFLLENNNS